MVTIFVKMWIVVIIFVMVVGMRTVGIVFVMVIRFVMVEGIIKLRTAHLSIDPKRRLCKYVLVLRIFHFKICRFKYLVDADGSKNQQ